MKKLRSFISVLMVLMLAIVGSISVFAVTFDDPEQVNVREIKTLNVSSVPVLDNLSVLVEQHLVSTKADLASSPETYGFSSHELENLALGTPFTVYVFDENANLIADDAYAYPLIYQSEIVGVIEAYKDTSSSDYCFTFGKSYSAELNKIISKETFANNNIIIGRTGNKLFATNGNEVEILLDIPVMGSIKTTKEKIQNICNDLVLSASSNFENVLTPISQAISNVKPNLNHAILSYPNPLPVPHVEQTGTCGVAAWAAVLNYRFSKSYTNATLQTAMDNGGYVNGSNGIPTMTDYRDYANDNYDAGCVWLSSPPSFLSLVLAINNGKPIMGSWWSNSPSDKSCKSDSPSGKSCHAILITGYTYNSSSNYTYTLKNPWYDYTQTITVTSSSSVIYADAGYTWNLSQVTY